MGELSASLLQRGNVYVEREPQLEKTLNQTENIFNVGSKILNFLSKLFAEDSKSVNIDE